jgi:hypothetical protein
MKRTMAVAALAIFLSLVAVAVRERAVDGAPSTPRNVLSSTGAKTDPAPGHWHCQFSTGQGASWRMLLTSAATPSAGTGIVVPPTAGPRFSAELSVEPLQTGDVNVLLARFSDVDAQTLSMQGAFSTPFLLKVTRACEVIGFAREATVALPTARAQQITVSGLWFRVPTQTPEQAQGRDGIGLFDAELFAGEVNGARLVQRKVRRYTQTWTGQPSPTVDDSFTTVTLGDSGWFSSLVSTEARTAPLVGAFKVELTMQPQAFAPSRLEGLARDESSYVWEDLLARAETPGVANAPRFTELERRQQEAVRGLTPERAMSLFRTQLETNQNVNTQWPMMARYLEVHPEAIPEYADALVSGGFSNRQLGTAFLALGKARVPQAREALLRLHSDATVLPLSRHRASLALVERPDVGLELAKQLRTESSTLSTGNDAQRFGARNSALALGMMVGVRPRSPEVQAEARAAIEALLATGRTARELSPAFGAMGNTGDPSYLEDLAPFTRNPDPDIRAVAPRGFRRLKPEQTEAFVLEWLARETSPDVKRELFHVLHLQHIDAQRDVSPELAHQAAVHLAQQPYLLTRQSLVRLLGPVAATNQEAMAVLLAQAPRELESASGLYTLIANYVPGEELSRVVDAHWPATAVKAAPAAEPSLPAPQFPAVSPGASSSGFVTESP